MEIKKMNCTDFGEYKVYEDDKYKLIRSKDYNYNFNKENGMFISWADRPENDAEFCKYGPNIIDMEISTICNGIGNPNKYNPKNPYDTCKSCSFCYKSLQGYPRS